jgi:hypothetical protein
MKRFAISILICFSTICEAQNLAFQNLASSSGIIVKANVLDFGRRMRFEDGVIEYSILCRVDESYKGTFQKNDTIRISIKEFSDDLGGRFSDSTSIKEKLIQKGKSLVFFLNKKPYGQEMMPSDSKLYPVYSTVDICLGVQAPTAEIIYYLEELAKQK